jgi:uncharacterized LabA/DUF88 family protein
MLPDVITPLRRIAVFYDGTFFQKVNHYYGYHHSRRKFIDLGGLHEYIRHRVAEFETNKNVSLCQIVEAHFFRGRFSLTSAKKVKSLESDRLQDQLLMYAGVVAHYYPMDESKDPPQEKGIDVWLALEAYDLAVHKRFDVLVLFAGDQDFVPLVRKVNGLGTRVLIIGVDITPENDSMPAQRTSRRLIEEASYTVMLSEEVDSKTAKGDSVIEGIFYTRKSS